MLLTQSGCEKKQVTVLKERKSRPCLVLWSSRVGRNLILVYRWMYPEVKCQSVYLRSWSISMNPSLLHERKDVAPHKKPIQMNQKCKRECANVEAYCLGLAKIKDSLSSSDRVIRETHPRIAHSNSQWLISETYYRSRNKLSPESGMSSSFNRGKRIAYQNIY